MALPVRYASMLPSIKCSNCGSLIEISMMGDHVCSAVEADAEDPDDLHKNSGETEEEELDTFHNPPARPADSPPRNAPSPVQEEDPPFEPQPWRPLSAKPPPIDPDAANGLSPHHGPLTPASTASNTLSASPNSPDPDMHRFSSRSAAAPPPRPVRPPSSDIVVSQDCAFPPFPLNRTQSNLSSLPSRPVTPVDLPAPAARSDQSLSLPQPAPIPVIRTNPNLLLRMNTIAPGPFNAKKKAQAKKPGSPDGQSDHENSSMSPKVSEAKTSFLGRGKSLRKKPSKNSISEPMPFLSNADSTGLSSRLDQFGRALPSGPAPPRPPRPDAVNLDDAPSGLRPSPIEDSSSQGGSPLARQDGFDFGSGSSQRSPDEGTRSGDDTEQQSLARSRRTDSVQSNGSIYSRISRHMPQNSFYDPSQSRPYSHHRSSSIGTALTRINESDNREPRRESRSLSSRAPGTRHRSLSRGASSLRPDHDIVPPLPNLASHDYHTANLQHTPSESTSSNGSKMGFDSRTASSRSSPPTSHASSLSHQNIMGDEGSDRNTSESDYFRPNNSYFSNNQWPARSQTSPLPTGSGSNPGTYSERADYPPPNMVESPVTIESPIENALTQTTSNSSRLRNEHSNGPQVPVTTSTTDWAKLSPSNARPSQARPRTQPSSKGPCRECGQDIIGKCIKSSDGRLTGRYHKECFVCKTCKAQFPTADFYVINNDPYCHHHYHSLNRSLCESCNHGIEGEYLETDQQKKYHTACFRCTDCRKPLSHDYYEMGARFYCRDDAFRVHQKSSLLGPGRRFPERRSTRLMMM